MPSRRLYFFLQEEEEVEEVLVGCSYLSCPCCLLQAVWAGEGAGLDKFSLFSPTSVLVPRWAMNSTANEQWAFNFQNTQKKWFEEKQSFLKPYISHVILFIKFWICHVVKVNISFYLLILGWWDQLGVGGGLYSRSERGLSLSVSASKQPPDHNHHHNQETIPWPPPRCPLGSAWLVSSGWSFPSKLPLVSVVWTITRMVQIGQQR